ncbi:MAG: hypothetical protein ACREEE_12480 [Dongiaceae bacterium]
MLAEEFTRDVPDDQDYRYKLSVAIAERLLGEVIVAQREAGMPEDLRYAGIIYPTVAMRANADNLALLPEFVDRCLALEQVECISVDSVDADKRFTITTHDFANSFAPDGMIEWQGRGPQWSLLPRATGRVGVENGQYVLRNPDGKIIDPS